MRRAGSGRIVLVEHAGLVRVEVVADQGDALRLGKVHIHQVLQDLGASQFGALRRHLHMPPALQGRRDHEQIGRARADVRIILAGGLSGPRRQSSPDFLMQDLGDLVHADHWMVGVQGALIGIQYLFPVADKITVGLRLQASAADFPRLQPVFFARATRPGPPPPVPGPVCAADRTGCADNWPPSAAVTCALCAAADADPR